MGEPARALPVTIPNVHTHGMEFMFGAIEELSTRTALDIDHIPNGGEGLAGICDLEPSPEMFEHLKVGEVPGSKHAMKFGSRPFASFGSKGLWDCMGWQERSLVGGLETGI